jgi:hypothetical protein
MSMADLFRQEGRKASKKKDKEFSIIEFIESPYGLGFSHEVCGLGLFPVQKFILKAYYSLPLDTKEKTIRIPKTWRYAQSAKPEHYYNFTEAEYMSYLFEEGRCNIKHIDRERHELVLPIGRRGGKTLISSMIAAYEVYRLLRKGNPQGYYGVQDGADISISTIATTKEQSQILYNGVRNHFQNCKFFNPYLSHDTQSYVKFQTPHDLDTTGTAKSGGRASVQIKFFSSVSSGLRGLSNIVILMDEVAFFKETGSSSADSVYQAASPSVATFAPADPKAKNSTQSEGRIILISSPFNKDGLFYVKYCQSKAGGAGSQDILMVQAPTWEVNPQVPIGYLENQHAKDPIAFSTEFGAEFTDRVMSWIEREKDLLMCIDPALKPSQKGAPRDPHNLGLDLAVKGDRTAVALTKVEEDQIKLVYHEEWQAGVPWEETNPHLESPFMSYARELHTVDMLDFDEIAEWIHALSRRFFITEGLFDQWQGISFQQTLDKMGLTQIQSRQFTRDETSQMFDAFKTLMYHNRLILYDYVVREVLRETDNDDVEGSSLEITKTSPYIRELLELRAERKSKKIIIVEAPPGVNKHDDFSDALVRSVWLSLGHKKSSKRNHVSRTGPQDAGAFPRYANATAYYKRKQLTQNYHSKRTRW